MRRLSLVLFAILFVTILSCDKEDDFSYPKATLSHYGFDFSEGISDTANWQNNDVEVIGWYPGGGTHPDYESGVWMRNDTDDLNNEQKDYGAVELSTIESAPNEWDTLISPLMVGHAYVVKCHDGYAKFEVISINLEDWEATVNFFYSRTDKFDE